MWDGIQQVVVEFDDRFHHVLGLLAPATAYDPNQWGFPRGRRQYGLGHRTEFEIVADPASFGTKEQGHG